jgi:hypothetical protein
MLDNQRMAPTPLAADTSPDVERLQVQAWRDMSSQQKAALVNALTTAVIQMAEAGVRDRHPHESWAMQRYRLAEVLHGPDLARKAYGHLLQTP